MARAPVPIFPQPRTGYLRQALGLLGIRGESAVARPHGDDPIKAASPTEDTAPVPTGVYSRSPSSFSIDPRWLNQLALNSDRILTEEGGAENLKLYEALLDDDVAASSFQQRRLAVVSQPWEVDPGDDSPQAAAAADHLREQLKIIGWDRICDRMLYGIWFGYAVGEAIYEVGPDGKIWMREIAVPDRAWFGFTNSGELRLKTAESPQGEIVPPNKFWAYRVGGSHDFLPYGIGLAHWCYWPVWFKRNVVKFWSIYLEKFGMPTAMGTFPDGAPDDVIAQTLEAASAVARDTAIAKPDNVNIELLAAGRTGEGSYLQFVSQMNDALLRIILSQTGTSKSEAQGLGGSQSEVMKDVRDEIVRADSDMLHESFNRTIARWLTDWNFGTEVPAPTVYRRLEEQEDLTKLAERDRILHGIGIKRTVESVRETYGEGYERDEPQEDAPPAIPGRTGGNVVSLAQMRQLRAEQEFATQDVAPLYVSRKLKPASARALLSWAASQGIPGLLPAAELHVTVLYSKAAVDWFGMEPYGWADGDLRVGEGGPRKVEKLGEQGAIVLRFASYPLKARHEEMVERGASHDFPEYLPHVTVGYAPDFDPEGIEPYQGPLEFGPEIFAPIDDQWIDRIASREFSADDIDQIERFAAQLATEADPIMREFAASLAGKTGGIKDVDQLRVALLDALETFPSDRLGELAALPLVAVRAEAEGGADALRA
jgi:phage gp29-like protein